MNKIDANLNTNFLKIIGMLTMLLDHIGAFLYPNILLLRIIGRIAFPIFAYCIVVGFLHTKNVYKYALRLAALALVTQAGYMLATGNTSYAYNIFITLLIGLLVLYSIEKKVWLLSICLLVVTVILKIQYGLMGIILMVIFYTFRKNNKMSILIAGTLLFLTIFFPIGKDFMLFGFNIQGFSVLSLPFIFSHAKIKVKLNKYFAYIFYPLHLAVIYIVMLIIK